ncbi:conserved protein of unknown function [Methanocaldococcus lauensis]|uniref:Segregation and condensation protein B n=2 Tax=Methanocaldococcus lauensis TaxID=2546128 RepID=A0A8D6PRV9_9EURY|nr:conserved protein of unknown function [Methanocaldococcus lauensis]
MEINDSGNMKIGITKMYEEISELIGLKDYKIVNPYNEKVDCDLLIISKGYKDKVKRLNPNSEIFEVKSATFRDLIETLEDIKKLKIGDENKINYSIKLLKYKEKKIKELAKNLLKDLNVEVNPITEFVKKIVEDLNLKISENGVLIVPDYFLKNQNYKNNKNNAKVIILKTHNYNLRLIERIEDRYLQIIQKLRDFHERTYQRRSK